MPDTEAIQETVTAQHKRTRKALKNYEAATNTEKPDWATLVGKAFHTHKDNKISHQGIIQSELYPKVFVITFFSWLDTLSTGEHVITLEEMIEEKWTFYSTIEQMRSAYDDTQPEWSRGRNEWIRENT
jgi:hypothetical protein